MITVIFRTVIVYTALMGALRLMGKRQIGELEVSELVTTLLISELATLPIENPELSVMDAAAPVVTLLLVELLSSVLLIKFPRLRGLFSPKPSVLVRNGVPIERELRRARITLEELLSALRQKEVSDIGEVDYAILEQNGQISVIRKKRYQPPDAETLGVSVKESGIMHILLSDGTPNAHQLKSLPNATALFEKGLRQAGCAPKDLFLMLADDKGNLRIVKKEGEKKRGDGA